MENKYIPLSVPNFSGNELKYVSNAVESEWVSTGGAYIKTFEENISKFVKSSGAVAVQSGTSGIHVGLILLGVKENDEVIVPALTFIAAVNPVKYLKADPVFMDCDKNLNLDTKKLKEFCKTKCNFKNGKLINKKTNKHIKAVVVVHIFGNIADMEELISLSKKYNLKILEDATEALGSYYTRGKFKGKFAGTIGHIGVYSFNGNKIITTGGGGMIVSNNKKILSRAKYLTTQAKNDELFYRHDEIGFNYRMTNLQAALGIAQLENLEQFIKTKRFNYFLYKERISKIDGLKILNFNKKIIPNYWFYSLYIEKRFPMKRDNLIKFLKSKNIESRPIWDLICDQKPYLKNQKFKIKKAKKFLKHTINLPCSSSLQKEDVDYICKILEDIK